MSSGRLGPPSRAPSCRRRKNEASPPGPDNKSTALPMMARSRASHARVVSAAGAAWPSAYGPGAAVASVPRRWCGRRRCCRRCRAVAVGSVLAGGVAAEPVELDAEADQVLQRGRVHLTGHERGHRRVTGHRPGRVPVQPRPAHTAARRGPGPVPRPPRADPAGPLRLQRRAPLQHHQVRQRDVHPRLDRLAGPLRQQTRGHEPLHRVLKRIMAPLRLAPGVLRARRGGQRIQHRAHDRRALRRQVPVHHPGTLERRLQLDRPVIENLVLVRALAVALVPGAGRVLSWPRPRPRPGPASCPGPRPSSWSWPASCPVLVLGLGPAVDLPGQHGQIPHIGTLQRRAEQDRIRVLLAPGRQLAGPGADRPGHRLRDLPGGQRRRDLRMRRRPPDPRGIGRPRRRG